MNEIHICGMRARVRGKERWRWVADTLDTMR